MTGARGFTLLETTVALAIVALLASVAAPALSSALLSAPPIEWDDALRRAAVVAGHPVTGVSSSGDLLIVATALPSGRVVADTTRLGDYHAP